MSNKTAKAQVEPVRQRTQYTCMASSMSMCLKALGHDFDEDVVNKVMGAAPMRGAAWEQALACAQHFGCRATLTMPSTIRQLKAWTDAGIPVMIAWNPEGRDWSHASTVFHVQEGPIETLSDDQTLQGSGPGLYVYVADPNIPNPDKVTRIVHEDVFYGAWYEKFPNYMVRRPACAIQREVTPGGRQVMASKVGSVGWHHDYPEADSSLVSKLEELAGQEGAEATNARDALEMLAWDIGYQGGRIPSWFKTLGKQLKVNVDKEYRSGVQAGRESGDRRASTTRLARLPSWAAEMLRGDESAVYSLLYEDGPKTSAEIEDEWGYSRLTVLKILKGLMEKGVITQQGRKYEAQERLHTATVMSPQSRVARVDRNAEGVDCYKDYQSGGLTYSEYQECLRRNNENGGGRNRYPSRSQVAKIPVPSDYSERANRLVMALWLSQDIKGRRFVKDNLYKREMSDKQLQWFESLERKHGRVLKDLPSNPSISFYNDGSLSINSLSGSEKAKLEKHFDLEVDRPGFSYILRRSGTVTPPAPVNEPEPATPSGRSTFDRSQTQEMISILDVLINRNPGLRMLPAFKRDLEMGKGLTENQLKAVRQTLYKNRMRSEADMFRLAAEETDIMAKKKPQSGKDKLKNPEVPKRRNEVVKQMVERSWGAGKHHNRDRDVAQGRSRKPKHKPDYKRDRAASVSRVADRFLSACGMDGDCSCKCDSSTEEENFDV